MDIVTNLIVVIISQYIKMASVHLKYIQLLSILPEYSWKKKENTSIYQ